MASLRSLWCVVVLLDFIKAATSLATSIVGHGYPAMFILGDSLSDPGNAAIASNSSSYRTIQFPYGETFPGWPFGRYSDGHTIVDFLASHMDLPLVNPYLNSSADFGGGVNYAVAGATALNVSFLNSLNIYPDTNISLDIQVDSHLAYKATVESCRGLVAGTPTTAAFVEGLYVIEIGGNDYARAYLDGNSPSFVNSTLIPLVVHKIRNAVETLIDNGATHFLFVSITPLGCSPWMLATFDGIKDSYGCLEEYNSASYLHGVRLQEEVANLRTIYPNASFAFMDYYGAYIYVLERKEDFGFVNTLEACCGAGDDYPYNYNLHDRCNINSISLCSDPDTYMSWDGTHFTDFFNFQIFNHTFIMGMYLDTPHSFV